MKAVVMQAVVLMGFLAIASGTASASSDTFIPIESGLKGVKEEPGKLWYGTIKFGYTSSTGNSVSSNLTGTIDVDRINGPWEYNIFFYTYSSSSSGELSAERYFLSNQLSRKVDEKNFRFIYGSFNDDHFSGYEFQSGVAVGVGRYFIDNKTTILKADIGPGYGVDRIDGTDTESSQILSGFLLRAAVDYSWEFAEGATLGEDIWLIAGFNTVGRSVTSLTVRVFREVHLSMSYTFSYTEDAAPGKTPYDTQTTMSLLYQF